MELGFDPEPLDHKSFLLNLGLKLFFFFFLFFVRLRLGRRRRDETENRAVCSSFLLRTFLRRFAWPRCHCFLEHALHSGFHLGPAATDPRATGLSGCHSPGRGQRGCAKQSCGHLRRLGAGVRLNQGWWILKIPFSCAQTNLKNKNIL